MDLDEATEGVIEEGRRNEGCDGETTGARSMDGKTECEISGVIKGTNRSRSR